MQYFVVGEVLQELKHDASAGGDDDVYEDDDDNYGDEMMTTMTMTMTMKIYSHIKQQLLTKLRHCKTAKKHPTNRPKQTNRKKNVKCNVADCSQIYTIFFTENAYNDIAAFTSIFEVHLCDRFSHTMYPF